MKIAKRKLSGKAIVLILAAAVLTVSVGVTVAFLTAETPPVTNTFQPVSVSCEVREDFNPASNVKDNVRVQNTGDISAYIRVAIVINWVSDSGSIYGGAPAAGSDYTITLAGSQNGWFYGTDGFYYYKEPVAAGAITKNLIDTIKPVTGAAPDGYTLSVQILATAIQAEPAEAITAVWPAVTVNDDGLLAP